MKCYNCKNEINDNEKFCHNCGKKVGLSDDKGSGWYLVLALFFPLIGIILYIIYHKDKPNTGKKLLIGSIIGYSVRIILPIIIFIVSFIFFMIMFIVTDTTYPVETDEEMESCALDCNGEYTVRDGKCYCENYDYLEEYFENIFDKGHSS